MNGKSLNDNNIYEKIQKFTILPAMPSIVDWTNVCESKCIANYSVFIIFLTFFSLNYFLK